MVTTAKVTQKSSAPAKDVPTLPSIWDVQAVEYVKGVLNDELDTGVKAASKQEHGVSAVQRNPIPVVKPAKTKVKTGTDVAVREDGRSRYSVQLQRRFAIETVNHVLQKLAKHCESAEKVLQSTTQLKASSGNRAIAKKREAGPKPANKTLPTSIAAEDDLRAIVQSGQIAYTYLRKHALSKTPHDGNDWNLENGMIAFCGKILGSGLLDLAKKELEAMKAHLDWRIRGTVMKPHNLTKQMKGSSTPSANVLQSSQTRLLAFDVFPETYTGLQPIINFQMLVLRMFVLSHGFELSPELIDQIDLPCSSSPLRNLEALSHQPNCADHAARQMDSFAQILLRLCGTQDAPLLSSKTTSGTSSSVRFRVEVLALQARMMWMKVAKHIGDPEHEVLRPFTKFVNHLSKAGDCNLDEIYNVARVGYHSVMENFNMLPRTISKKKDSKMSYIVELKMRMSQLAEAAQKWDDACQYLMSERTDCDSKVLPEHRAVLQFRNCALRLKSPGVKDTASLEVILQEATLTIEDEHAPILADESMYSITEVTKIIQSILQLHEKLKSAEENSTDPTNSKKAFCVAKPLQPLHGIFAMLVSKSPRSQTQLHKISLILQVEQNMSSTLRKLLQRQYRNGVSSTSMAAPLISQAWILLCTVAWSYCRQHRTVGRPLSPSTSLQLRYNARMCIICGLRK